MNGEQSKVFQDYTSERSREGKALRAGDNPVWPGLAFSEKD